MMTMMKALALSGRVSNDGFTREEAKRLSPMLKENFQSPMFLFLSGGIGLVWFASSYLRIIWAICQHSPLDTANTGQHSHNLKPSGRSNLGKHWKKENIWEFSQNVRQFFFVSWVFMGDLRELFLRFLVLGIGKTSPPPCWEKFPNNHVFFWGRT